MKGRASIYSILHNFSASLYNPYGFRLTLLGLALAWETWLLRFDQGLCIVGVAVLAAVGAHLAFGQIDWFHRYEVYIIALVTLALLYATAHLKPLLGVPEWTAAKLGIVWLIGFGTTPYIIAAVKTPAASRGIYDQQYQMSVFARQLYDRPVAVNDLGLVAYKNPNFVLDLWGLGSEKVRKAKLAGQYGPRNGSPRRGLSCGLNHDLRQLVSAGCPGELEKDRSIAHDHRLGGGGRSNVLQDSISEIRESSTSSEEFRVNIAATRQA